MLNDPKRRTSKVRNDSEKTGTPTVSADSTTHDKNAEMSRRKRSKTTRAPFQIAGHPITAGRRKRLELPIGNLMSGTPVALPLIVVHGKKDGPVVWLSAAIHGDEINGVEIIRMVLDAVSARNMCGTIIAAPIVNVHGFNNSDRYLPDRRDLNRCFPGSSRGSLAARIADLFMTQVVNLSDVGIDLHTGSDLRTNLPQIRCNLDHPNTLALAEAFGAPVIIDSRVRDGSLRQAAVESGKTMLLFEGGEASRFDRWAIEAGTNGVLRCLNYLGVTEIEIPDASRPLYSHSTGWSRAGKSGIVHIEARLGDRVSAKQKLATIYDPFGKTLGRVKARFDGVVIGHTQAPVVNRGDAVSHVARVIKESPSEMGSTVMKPKKKQTRDEATEIDS